MLSVDRVVRRHVVARKGIVGEAFVEAPLKPGKKNAEPHLALKTFRLGMYQVLERQPVVESDNKTRLLEKSAVRR